jgi:putative ABC transport system permease protein
MRVNFFVISSPDVLQDLPTSYLSSFYLPADKVAVGDQLSHEFPNLLLIDTEAIIAQVRDMMEKISQTMSVVFLFTLASGLVVLYAALLASQDERTQEAAILRTLGADSRYLTRLHLTEFAVLGGLSGLFAAGGAVLLGALLAHFVLDIGYHSGWESWLVGIGGGLALVMLAGWLAVRRLVRWSPLRILTAD